MLAHQFNWEAHHQVMSEVVNLLASNNLIPSKLGIQSDGWTEAVFVHENSLEVKRVWLRLQKRGVIEIMQPIVEVDTEGGTMLRVKFRVLHERLVASTG